MSTISAILGLLVLGGITRTHAQVAGVVPPSITNGPAQFPPTYIRIGTTSNPVPCTASGSSPISYLWYNNGLAVPSSYVGSDGSLNFNPAQPTDQGYYTCYATNQGGTAISNTTRAVFAMEAVFPAPTDTGPNNVKYNVNVGDSIKILCSPTSRGIPKARAIIATDLSSKPTSEYAWYDDGGSVKMDVFSTGRLQLDDDGNLLIVSAMASDAVTGLKCWITNTVLSIVAGGTPSNIVVNTQSITSNSPPVIMYYSNQTYNPDPTQPTVVLGIERRQVVMRCIFKGSPDIKVLWRKEVGLAPDPSRIIMTPNTYQTSYIINNLQKSDEGAYYCQGTNSIASTSFKIQLVLQSAPMFLSMTDGPYDNRVSVGDSVTIFCKTYANPTATVTWLINGQPFSTQNLDPKKFQVNSAANSFLIKNVCKNCEGGVSDTRVVQCNASNIHGYVIQNGYMNVLERTVINTTNQGVSTAFKETVMLNITATTDPSTPITFVWKLNGQPLYNETNKLYILANGTLLIMNTGPNDLGQYECNATNGVSWDSVVYTVGNPDYGAIKAYIWPYWWIPLIILIIVLLFILIVLLVCCMIYRNRGDEYPVDEKERQSGNDPEKELHESGFHDFQRQNQERRESQDSRKPMLGDQSHA